MIHSGWTNHRLDAGCGSGHDTNAFLDRGYQVAAIDASKAIAQLSSELTDQPTLLVSFDKMPFDNCFEGIWACPLYCMFPSTSFNWCLTDLSRD